MREKGFVISFVSNKSNLDFLVFSCKIFLGFKYLNEVKETIGSSKPSYGEGDYPSAYNQVSYRYLNGQNNGQ